MKAAFLVISTLIITVSVLPYIIDILKGKTRPNIVSWITWTLLTGIATAAEIAAGEYVTAIFTGVSTMETATVVLLGLRHGFVRYTRFDVICQFATIVGIILWQVFNSPALAVIATVVIDLIGGLPTLRHSWQKPNEETWQTFVLGSLGALFAILALTDYNVTSLAFPLYLTIINATMASVIYLRRMKKTKRV